MDKKNQGVSPATPKAAPAVKRSGSKKISNKLVALSAAAILSVYVAGYARTESAAAQLATPPAKVSPASPVTTNGSAAASPVATSSPTAASVVAAINQSASPSVPTAAPTASPTAAPSPTAVSGYKNGTYTGVGSSRHGGIQVQVTIQNGRIAAAKITGASTRYPASVISSLPGTVVAQQSTNVDIVSGATDSSNAYLDAVDSALNQAS